MINITQAHLDIIYKIEDQLRSILDENKLWENTYIKKQIDDRRNGYIFSINDHIRGMVYSMLSSGNIWARIAKEVDEETKRIPAVDDVFCNYNTEELLKISPQQLKKDLRTINCLGRNTEKQMEALINVNIPRLKEIDDKYGSIDSYYKKYIEIDKTFETLILVLSAAESRDKLEQMGIALVSEYLRNVGYDIPKPDRHICRILSRGFLNFSDCQTVTPFEAFDIISMIAERTNKSKAEIDYILWAYCAKGYGEICTVPKPKCDKCIAKSICNKL